MAALRDVLLGGIEQLIRPDATEDFSGSLDDGVVCHLRSATLQPFGEIGEGLLKRIYVQGYHRGAVRMLVTPIIDGRFRNEFTSYLQLAAPPSGRFDRFSLIATPLESPADWTGFSFSPRGTAFAVHVELRAPRGSIFPTSAVPTFEPLGSVRSRGVRE